MSNPPSAEWQAVAARMASCAEDRHGAPRIITMRVLVRADGTPVVWARPQVTVLEPKSAALDALLEAFADGC